MAEEIQENEGQVKGSSETTPEVEQIRKEREDYLEGWRRAKADFINYKKDELKRFKQIAEFGNEELIRNLIPVLDSFALGLTMLEKAGVVEKGVYMIKSQLEDVLRRQGLQRIIVTAGDKFDPNYHEAVGTVPSGDAAGTIVEEMEAGYVLHGKVIRPARVKIAQ